MADADGAELIGATWDSLGEEGQAASSEGKLTLEIAGTGGVELYELDTIEANGELFLRLVVSVGDEEETVLLAPSFALLALLKSGRGGADVEEAAPDTTS